MKSKSSNYSQSKSELVTHLKDQIVFMIASAISFDNGLEGEAKRLAVVIRVLVHDTDKSTSLLTLIGKKNIKFYDMAIPYNPLNLLSYNALTMMVASGQEWQYTAPLDFSPPNIKKTKKLSFKVWWQGMFVIKDKGGETFTRKDLILNVANKEGGAHIDPKLNQAYADLSRFNSLGWKLRVGGVEKDFTNTVVLPSVRQITHEVMKTLRDNVIDLFSYDSSVLEKFQAYDEHCKMLAKPRGTVFYGPEAILDKSKK